MQASEQTGGIFDVTCAPLINLWGFGFTKFDSITPQLVDSIRHFVGFRKVHLQGNRVMKGKNPQGWNWCIGIVRPKDDSTGTNSELEQIVQLSERLGLATSGNYRNFYLKDGRKYAHAINPITGYPVQKDILSATIIAHQCMLADAYATAFMTLGSRKARQL